MLFFSNLILGSLFMNSAQRHKNLNELFNLCKNVHGRIFIASAIGDIWDSYANFCPINVWNEYFVDSWNNFSIGGGAMNKVAFCTPSNQCQEKVLHFREIDFFFVKLKKHPFSYTSFCIPT